jgi:hypothetical protein
MSGDYENDENDFAPVVVEPMPVAVQPAPVAPVADGDELPPNNTVLTRCVGYYISDPDHDH